MKWGVWRGLRGDEPQRADYAVVALVFAGLAGCLAVWEVWIREKQSQIVAGMASGRRAAGEALRMSLRQNYCSALQVRFGPELPVDLQQAVEGQNDQATLDRWFDLALTTASLDQYRTAVGANGDSGEGGARKPGAEGDEPQRAEYARTALAFEKPDRELAHEIVAVGRG